MDHSDLYAFYDQHKESWSADQNIDVPVVLVTNTSYLWTILNSEKCNKHVTDYLFYRMEQLFFMFKKENPQEGFVCSFGPVVCRAVGP